MNRCLMATKGNFSRNASARDGFRALARYRAAYVNERGELMGFAQHYRSEGEQAGIKKGILIGEEKGREEGRKKEAAQLPRRLLTRRFGPLRIPVGAIHELPLRPDRILDAESLDAVFVE